MPKNGKIELLAQIPLFSACSRQELKVIASIADEISAPAGAVLMKQGDVGRDLYVIAEGKVAVVRSKRKLAMLGPGEVVGELAILLRTPRSATVTAETDVVAYAVPGDRFNDVLTDAPSVARKLLRSLAERLLAAEESLSH